MTERSRLGKVQAELLRAEKSLAAARSLLKDDFLEDALSRAYYSILHAARAVLLAEGVSVSSHRAVRRLFGHHLVKPGKLAVRLAKILAEEQYDQIPYSGSSSFPFMLMKNVHRSPRRGMPQRRSGFCIDRVPGPVTFLVVMKAELIQPVLRGTAHPLPLLS
jgi:uncharacterized protein (UPF0332 family)